jgi:hypothetical protein
MSLELRRSEFETAALVLDLYTRGLLAVDQVHPPIPTDPVAAIRSLLALASQRLDQRRYDAALEAYEEVLALDRLNLHAKKGLLALTEARRRERPAEAVPRERVPALAVDLATLTTQSLDPQEGFVLSRVNGEWDVQSILKVCPMAEEETLVIFSRLLQRGLIELR